MCKVKKNFTNVLQARPLQTSNAKGTITVAEATQMDVRSLRHLREIK